MSRVRVVVTINAPSAEAAEAALEGRIVLCKRTEAEEEGCLQYEVFRSAMRPERLMLVELWESLAIYDRHWHLQQERERVNPLPPPGTPGRPVSVIEFYKQAIYGRVDGIWQSVDPEDRCETVRWI